MTEQRAGQDEPECIGYGSQCMCPDCRAQDGTHHSGKVIASTPIPMSDRPAETEPISSTEQPTAVSHDYLFGSHGGMERRPNGPVGDGRES